METAVTFPGLPAIVPSVRKLVRGILADSPCADDMELIAAELASNYLTVREWDLTAQAFRLTEVL